MTITSTWCSVQHAMVSRILTLEGDVSTVICPEFDPVTRSLPAEEGGESWGSALTTDRARVRRDARRRGASLQSRVMQPAAGRSTFASLATAQNLPAKDTRNAMHANDRRLIVDHSFDCTVETVIDAFLREGLTVTPMGGGDLRQQSGVGVPLRYAVLEATLPEPAFDMGGRRADATPVLKSQIAVYELVGRCTMVTATSPVADQQELASLVPRLTDRVGSALCTIIRSRASTHAA